MRDFAFAFDGGQVDLDWSAEVSGIHNVKQKLINNLMTDIGTDEVVPERGTSLLRSVTGGGVYSLRSAQHALNFAALSAKRTVRTNEPVDALPGDRVADFTAELTSVVGRDLLTRLSLKTADGSSIGLAQPII